VIPPFGIKRGDNTLCISAVGERADSNSALKKMVYANLDLQSILADYMDVDMSDIDQSQAAEMDLLKAYFEEIEVPPGEVLVEAGECNSYLYFIKRGVVELKVRSQFKTELEHLQ